MIMDKQSRGKKNVACHLTSIFFFFFLSYFGGNSFKNVIPPVQFKYRLENAVGTIKIDLKCVY